MCSGRVCPSVSSRAVSLLFCFVCRGTVWDDLRRAAHASARHAPGAAGGGANIAGGADEQSGRVGRHLDDGFEALHGEPAKEGAGSDLSEAHLGVGSSFRELIRVVVGLVLAIGQVAIEAHNDNSGKQDGKSTKPPHSRIIGARAHPAFIPTTRPTRAAQPLQASGAPSSAINNQAWSPLACHACSASQPDPGPRCPLWDDHRMHTPASPPPPATQPAAFRQGCRPLGSAQSAESAGGVEMAGQRMWRWHKAVDCFPALAGHFSRTCRTLQSEAQQSMC